MTTRTRGLLAALVVPASLALTLSACGSSSSDRPTTSEISDSLQHGKAAELFGSATAIPAKAADCIAKSLHDSKLSAKTLDALVKGDESYKGSKDDEKALTDVTSKMTSCISTAP